ncbi:MAG: universal stress protein [Acidimicrobiia bacterium]
MRIVIATDLTESSLDAARYGVQRARLADASVTVAHVVGSTDIDTRDAISYRYQMRRQEPDAKPVVEEFVQAKANEVQAWFEDTVGDVIDLDIEYAIEFGDLPDVIWHIVKEAKADSIVVGVHGRHGVGRHLTRILLDATIPVVVVRQGIYRGEL